MHRSRVRVWEMISRNERRELLNSPWRWGWRWSWCLRYGCFFFFLLFIFSFLSLVQLILPLVERGRGMEIWVGKRVRVRIVVCWGYGWVKDIWYALWLNILVEDVFRYRYEGIYIFSKNEMKIVVSAKYTFCHICNKLAQQPQSIADTHRRAVIFHQ